MIPRTKHLVIATLGIFGVFALVGGLMSVGTGKEPVALMLANEALLVEGVPSSPEVIIVSDTTRSDMREKLTGKLKEYAKTMAEKKREIVVPSVEEEMEVTREEPEAQEILKCDGENTRSLPSWGPVTVSIGEGARVIRSSALDAAGNPLNVLQLPLSPIINDAPSCLSGGMIALLRDGTVVTRETKVTGIYEGIAGYALDGFPVFSSFEDGRTLMSKNLDECHGHVHEIVDEGVVRSLYHYHITDDAPYTLACFRGVPHVE